tara:strand:- start:1045 stop:1455 length:411 start_codon:yes stop_codon:yes gene_type:complete
MKEASQWDGDVASAIQAKASNMVTQSIRNASWGWLSAPRGGQCELNMNDIMVWLSIVLLVWIIKVTLGNEPKPEPEPLEPPEPPEPPEPEPEQPPKPNMRRRQSVVNLDMLDERLPPPIYSPPRIYSSPSNNMYTV